jgi:tetratricopeptide (TPR) repeat protein
VNKQILTVAAGLLAVLLLFFFGKTVSKKSELKEVPNQVAGYDILKAIDELKNALTPSQSATIKTYEAALSQGSDQEKAHVHHQLANYWKDSLQSFSPYIYHLSEASKLENSEKNLNFAAHLMLDNLRMEQDPAKMEWLTSNTIDLFERALKLNPANDDYKIGIGSAYVFGKGRTGDPQATMQGIQTLLEVANRDTNNMKAQLVLGIGGMISGQFDKAEARFLKVINHQPNNLEAIAYLADTYAAQGKKEEAIKWYNISKKLADNPHYTQEVNERIRQLK